MILSAFREFTLIIFKKALITRNYLYFQYSIKFLKVIINIKNKCFSFSSQTKEEITQLQATLQSMKLSRPSLIQFSEINHILEKIQIIMLKRTYRTKYKPILNLQSLRICENFLQICIRTLNETVLTKQSCSEDIP